MAKLDKTNLTKTQIKILLQEKRNKKLAKQHQKNLNEKFNKIIDTFNKDTELLQKEYEEKNME